MATQKQIDDATALVTIAEQTFLEKKAILNQISEAIRLLQKDYSAAAFEAKKAEGRLDVRKEDLNDLTKQE